jgi:hypothetical protein
MGIIDDLNHYVGGTEYYYGFTRCSTSPKSASFLTRQGFSYSCAVQHSSSYLRGDYTHALQAFQLQLVYLLHTLKWDMVVVVFDGGDSELKTHERQRRDISRETASSSLSGLPYSCISATQNLAKKKQDQSTMISETTAAAGSTCTTNISAMVESLIAGGGDRNVTTM